MITLDTPTKVLEVVLAGAPATTQLPCVAAYFDLDQSSAGLVATAESDGLTAGTTPVAWLPAPAAIRSRVLRFGTVQNADTAPAILTVNLNNNGTRRAIWQGTLQVGDTLIYEEGHGFSVLDTNGQIKTAANTAGLPLALLRAHSGTDASAGATTVDSIAISGLTAADRLLVEYALQSDAQPTAQPLLYNVTDTVSLSDLSASPLAAGVPAAGVRTVLQQAQDAATHVLSVAEWADSSPTSGVSVVNATFVTPWTGTWTLGLRHGGVTAGGTFRYTWAVYVLRGQ